MQVVAQARTDNRQWNSTDQLDVVLMDLQCPLDGVAAITQIRAKSPTAHIIIPTTYEGDEDIYRGPKGAREATCSKTPLPRNCLMPSA